MKLRGEVRTHRCSSPHLLCAVCMYVLLEADIHIFKSNQSYAYLGGEHSLLPNIGVTMDTKVSLGYRGTVWDMKLPGNTWQGII